MTFFESLLVLFAVAIALLQIARRIALPYPSMLAAAGVLVASIPGTPVIPIAPDTALALFIAPVLLDAAYDFPIGAARKLMAPLLVYAVGAVLVTALVVAALGHMLIGLPIAAALALGAIVAPPDAAAATAVLVNLPVSRRVDAVLKGESLFNDATALLLFTTALTLQSHGGVDGATALRLGLAVPGGILFGIGYGLLARRLQPLVENSVGGTLLQFLHAFATWIIAEHLHLSAVLATVASGMTVAANVGTRDSPRMRVHSFAVWTTIVFMLNVLAFLLMGMQARQIFGGMSQAALVRAGWFAAAVVVAAIGVRLTIAFAYRGFILWHARGREGEEPLRPGETLLIGWSGMRGLVTMATAFALPRDFPERDTVVLAAFAVVLATLVVQGCSLVPLIRWLGLERDREAHEEREQARAALADAALERLADEPGDAAEQLRAAYHDVRAAADPADAHRALDRRHGLALAAILAERKRLEQLRADHVIGPDRYLELQEDLDWKQLAVISDEDRRIAES